MISRTQLGPRRDLFLGRVNLNVFEPVVGGLVFVHEAEIEEVPVAVFGLGIDGTSWLQRDDSLGRRLQEEKRRAPRFMCEVMHFWGCL
jgi:hypothetical protein